MINAVLPNELLDYIFELSKNDHTSEVCCHWYHIVANRRNPPIIEKLKRFNMFRNLKLGSEPHKAALFPFHRSLEEVYKEVNWEKRELENNPSNALRVISERETRINLYFLYELLKQSHTFKSPETVRLLFSWTGVKPVNESRLAEPGYLQRVFEANRESFASRRALELYRNPLPDRNPFPEFCVSHYFLPNLGMFWNLKILKIVPISYKRERMGLRGIPREIATMKQLEKLEISFSFIPDIPDFLGEMTQLRALTLNDNQHEYIPESFLKLTNLRHLNLDNNCFTSLPEGFGQLRSLRVVWLSKNRLKTVPDSVSQLDQLAYLNLWDNPIEILPNSLLALPQLKAIPLNPEKVKLDQETIDKFGRLHDFVYDLDLLPEYMELEETEEDI